MTAKTTRFNRTRNRGTAVCAECGKRTWTERIDTSTGLCQDCYDRAGIINEHEDGHHKGNDPRCPPCQAGEGR